jgi:PAS domain S-box-containing protein
MDRLDHVLDDALKEQIKNVSSPTAQVRPHMLDEYQNIFEAASDGLIIYDWETGRVVEANHAASAMHGYTREEFIGLYFTGFTHPDSHPLFAECEQTVKSGGVFEALALHMRQDGSPFYVEVRGTMCTFQGRTCLLEVGRDVTNRVQAGWLLQQQVEFSTSEQAALLEISQTLASALELQPGLILDQLRVIIKYTHATLFALEDSALITLAVRGPRPLEQGMTFRVPLDGPETLATLFNGHRPIRIANIWSAEPAAQFLQSLLNHQAALFWRACRRGCGFPWP